jgi:hypothetical protein
MQCFHGMPHSRAGPELLTQLAASNVSASTSTNMQHVTFNGSS